MLDVETNVCNKSISWLLKIAACQPLPTTSNCSPRQVSNFRQTIRQLCQDKERNQENTTNKICEQDFTKFLPKFDHTKV